MSKAKKGDLFTCEVCGLVVAVDESCDCAIGELICCDIPMEKGKAKKMKKAAKPAKKAAAKKPVKKAAPKKAAAKKPVKKAAPKKKAAPAKAKKAAKPKAKAKK